MDEYSVKRELERMYRILEEMKLLANNCRQEIGNNDHNLREAIRHLGAYYLEAAEEFRYALEQKASKEKEEESTGY